MVKAIATTAAGSSRERNQKHSGAPANGHAAPNGHSGIPRREPTARELAARQRRSAEAAARRKLLASTPIVPPFTIIFDQREGIPYGFTNLHADADQQSRPLAVEVVKGHLETGDYSIVGLERLLCVERKSVADLYGTLGGGRARFEAEHERMAAMTAAGGFACVVIEASLRETLLQPPDSSRLSSKTVDRTRLSWMQRYHVPWLFEDGRRRAEVTTFRLLETFWRHREEARQAEEAARQRKFEELF